jgi:hypothetical protein
MCAHPILPSFQAIQARTATIATTIIMAANSALFVNMFDLASEGLAIYLSFNPVYTR